MVHPHTHKDPNFPYRQHFPPDVNEWFWGALQVYPGGRVYEGLEPDEQVVMLVRRHPIVLLRPAAAGVGLSLLPLAAAAAVWLVPPPEAILQYTVVLIWFLLTFTVYYFFSVFLRYRADVWIITNERIIDIDTNVIALKATHEVDLSAVAGASQVRGGGLFLGGIDRGAVLVRIIGEEDALLPDVPMSGPVAQVIGELAEAVQRERGVLPGMMDMERQR